MTTRATVVLYLALAAAVAARDKTDVLVMKNGDRITCEVKRLEGGVLEVSLDYVDGSIAIDWEKVARLESNAIFAVQLQDGSTYAGQVITPENLPGQAVTLEVLPLGAEEPIEVAQDDVVRITQASESLFRRFNGAFSLGALYSKGNDTTQYNFSSDLSYVESRWEVTTRYNSNLSSSSGSDTSTRHQGDIVTRRLTRRKNLFYLGNASYLQSSVQGIEQQYGAAGGVGMFLRNRNTFQWDVLGGAGYFRTQYVPAASSQQIQNLGVFLGGTTVRVFEFKKTRLNLTAAVAPAFTDWGRYLLRGNASYYLKLFGTFDWNISLFGNYDSRPPPQFVKSDYGASGGLSWSFGNH